MLRSLIWVISHLIISVFCHINFVFPPGQSRIYAGYIWSNAKKVYLRPRLQAIPEGDSTFSRKLCGIDILTPDGHPAPFFTEIIDHKYGFADILVNRTIGWKPALDEPNVFKLEAYDCSVPPHRSRSVPISIQLVSREGPFFAEASYTFTVSQQSYSGSVVGQVQAIQQLRDEEDEMHSAICGYQLSLSHMPFAIDNHGVIRVQGKLQPRGGHRPYVFQVIAEDCLRPTPRRATVDVVVNQITDGCQSEWKGLPIYLESHGITDKPEKLLRPHKIYYKACTGTCADPKVEARLELKSALTGHKLKTANPDSCLHDPEHLYKQRMLCDLHPTTLTNLLPNPDQDIASQLVSSSLGNPPRLTAPTRAWRFDSSSRTVWQLDSKHLGSEVHMNAFDSDFTVAFWLRRHAKPRGLPQEQLGDKEEIILCSHDQNEPVWRFMSISFQDCLLVVRLLASLQPGPSTYDTRPRVPTVWTFGPLSDEYCVSANRESDVWHHYAITFSRSPWGVTTEIVSLLVDGQDLGASGAPTATHLPGLPPYVPAERKARPRITVGACFDPATQLTRQHLNADLAGLTILLERAEAPSNLRCVAQCGESLIVPDLLKYLRSDVSVSLESNAISVIAQNVSHVLDVLHAIAYVRPQADVSPDYTPHATQARLLNLTTLHSCGEMMEISSSEIKLYVLPEQQKPDHDVQLAHPANKGRGSVWMPQNPNIFDRPPIAQADMERKAWLASINSDQVNIPPSLIIEGSDVVITEPPIGSPGIQVFSDIRFMLPDEDSRVAAAAVPLDSCLVWVASSGDPNSPVSQPGLRESEEERIEWSVEQVVSLGLSGANDKHGVQVTGLRPAGDYETLLKTLHYWPPKSVRTNEKDKSVLRDPYGNGEVRYSAKIGLICTMDSGKRTTSQFFVNMIVESPDNAMRDLSSEESIKNLSPDEAVQPNYVQSDRERRRLPEEAAELMLKAENLPVKTVVAVKPAETNRGLAIGLSVAAAIIIIASCLTIIAYVKSQTRSQVPQKRTKRRRFPTQPADFGGSSLKHDPTLRLTANPLGELEYTGIGTVSEDLYGSSRNLVQSPHIFSPPTTDMDCPNRSLWTNARLAGLEEFDEDYMEDECFDDSHDPSSEVFSNTASEDKGTYHADKYGADVHDWIDGGWEQQQDDQAKQPPSTDTNKHDLMAECAPSKFGSPVVGV